MVCKLQANGEIYVELVRCLRSLVIDSHNIVLLGVIPAERITVDDPVDDIVALRVSDSRVTNAGTTGTGNRLFDIMQIY